MNIRSSIFSFVDFNPHPDDTACADAQMILPAVEDFGIKFQVIIGDITAATEIWTAPVNLSLTPVLPAKALLSRLCGRLVFNVPFTEYPITVSAGNGLAIPSLPFGTYNSPGDVLAALKIEGEFLWHLGDTDIYTDSCCVPSYPGNYMINGATINNRRGFILNDFAFYADIPAVSMNTLLGVGECFRYAIYDQDPAGAGVLPTFVSSMFKRVAPNCYVTKIECWNNEDAFDFYYPNTNVRNSAWLYIYLSNPTNPTKEGIYVERSGKRRLTYSVMDEEYILKTEHFTMWLHRKVQAVMLHDYKNFTNSYMGLINEPMAKSAAYEIDWDDQVPTPKAPAKGKLVKNISYTNSNCGSSYNCPTCASEVTGIVITIDGVGGGAMFYQAAFTVTPADTTLFTVKVSLDGGATWFIAFDVHLTSSPATTLIYAIKVGAAPPIAVDTPHKVMIIPYCVFEEDNMLKGTAGIGTHS